MAAQQDEQGGAVMEHDQDRLDRLFAGLLRQAPRMGFMQFCRLLEDGRPDWQGFGTQETAMTEPVRFRPQPRVGFPAGEVARVEIDEEDDAAVPTVRTTFMGLYGVDAAMPSHLIDEIVLREEGSEVVQAFLDQFNHRFVTLLYRAWKKYRYPEQFRAGGRDAHSRRLLCLAGFGWGDKPGRSGLGDARMLALLGLLVQHTRTADGLAGMVAMAVPGVEATVDEFWPVTTRVDRPLALGANRGGAELRHGGLGGAYVLGRRMVYRSKAVRLTLRPADAGQAQGLLPGAQLHADLMAFLRLYIGVKADVHLRMQVRTTWLPSPVIGQTVQNDPAPRLGWTTVLPGDGERLIHVALGMHVSLPPPSPNPHLSPELNKEYACPLA